MLTLSERAPSFLMLVLVNLKINPNLKKNSYCLGPLAKVLFEWICSVAEWELRTESPRPAVYGARGYRLVWGRNALGTAVICNWSLALASGALALHVATAALPLSAAVMVNST